MGEQTIRQRLAMLAAKTEAARQLLYHCAWLVDQRRDAVREISMLKALTGELVNEVAYDCQQFQAAWATCARAPSSGSSATRACWRSAAAHRSDARGSGEAMDAGVVQASVVLPATGTPLRSTPMRAWERCSNCPNLSQVLN